MMNENPSTVSGNMAMGYDMSNDSGMAAAGSVEASILMDDIMNNGMTFCSIM